MNRGMETYINEDQADKEREIGSEVMQMKAASQNSHTLPFTQRKVMDN